METIILTLFEILNIKVQAVQELKGQMLERDVFLDEKKYDAFIPEIQKLKKYLSSSSMTALQETAQTKQKQPLLNIVRQILKLYFLKMTPKRKADGYEKNGKKKYKRFYLIEPVVENKNNANEK